jgi:hypothetical protein
MSNYGFSLEQSEDDPSVSRSWDDDKQPTFQREDDPKTSRDWDKDKERKPGQGDKK